MIYSKRFSLSFYINHHSDYEKPSHNYGIYEFLADFINAYTMI